MAIAIAALLVTLALRPGSVHPELPKQAVVKAVLTGYKPGQFSRVEAKLMYRQDLERAASQWVSDRPNQLIWVVAVSGNFGIGPSFGCCSVPADYPGHNTWGMAIIVDKQGVPEINEFEGSWHGDWPRSSTSFPTSPRTDCGKTAAAGLFRAGHQRAFAGSYRMLTAS